MTTQISDVPIQDLIEQNEQFVHTKILRAVVPIYYITPMQN